MDLEVIKMSNQDLDMKKSTCIPCTTECLPITLRCHTHTAQ